MRMHQLTDFGDSMEGRREISNCNLSEFLLPPDIIILFLKYFLFLAIDVTSHDNQLPQYEPPCCRDTRRRRGRGAW